MSVEKPAAAVETRFANGRNTGTEQDEAAMAEVGKIQQVQRNFGFWTILGLTASMVSQLDVKPTFKTNVVGRAHSGYRLTYMF